MRRSKIHDNHGAGIDGVEPGFLVDSSELLRNGSAATEAANASGMKIADASFQTGNGTVQRTYAHDNTGNGLWTDCGATNVTIQKNTVVRNSRKGIFAEISAGPIYVLHNTVKSNNSENQTTAGGIAVVSSQHVYVQNNSLAKNVYASINIVNDSRAGNSATLPCQHGFVLSDILVSGNSLGGNPIYGCSTSGVSCSGNAP